MCIKAFAGPWVMSLAIILFILVLQLMMAYMHEIAGKGLGLGLIGKMFFYASGRLMMQAMPVAILAGALMTFGGMGERNELAALKSSGVSLFRVAKPMAALAAVITAFMLWFSFELVPASALKFYSLLYDVGRKKAELTLKPGHFYGGIDDYVIRISDKDMEKNTLYDVLIYNHTRRHEGIDVIAADSAKTVKNKANQLRMVLYAGVRHEELAAGGRGSGKKNHGRTYFDSLYYTFNLEGFELNRTDEKLFSRHYMTLSQSDLAHTLDSLEKMPAKSMLTFQNYIAPYTKVDSSYIRKAVRDSIRAEVAQRVPVSRPPEKFRKEDAKAKGIPREMRRSAGQQVEDSSGQDTVRTYPDTVGMPLAGTFLDRYPDVNRIEIINKALGSARSVKNYAEFMIGKQGDQDKRKRRYVYEYQLRWAMPFQCFLFMLIGISLGAIIRKGGMGVPGIISVAVLILSYIVQSQGRSHSRDGALDPTIGAWLPIIFFGPLAISLLYMASREAKILDEESRGKVLLRLWRAVRLLLRF